MLRDYLSEYAAKRGFDSYTELRGQTNTQKAVTILNGSMTANTTAEQTGFSARVCKNGAYGFACRPEYTAGGIEETVKAAEENAAFLESRERPGKPPFKKVAPLREELRYTRSDDVSQKYLIEFASELDALVEKNCPGLMSRFAAVRCLDMEKALYTSDGVFAHSMTPRSSFLLGLTVQGGDGSPVELFESFGGFGVFDEVFARPSAYEEKIRKMYEQVRRKAEGVYAEPGVKQVILDADLAGILAHEAVGHTVEADFVLSGSVGGPFFGKQVASPMVTLVDFAYEALGARCPVPVYVDDEGTPASDAVLIENGILTGYMHNKESAAHFGHEPRGNARAFAYSDEPLIRMRNTCILPGRDKLEDMMASIDDGYYFIKTGNGQADSTGEFMFGVNFGYEIKKGKLGRAVKDTTIAGVAFEVLKTVDMLSDDLAWSCTGMCGKKQMIPVGMGGPAIRCKINVGGR